MNFDLYFHVHFFSFKDYVSRNFVILNIQSHEMIVSTVNGVIIKIIFVTKLYDVYPCDRRSRNKGVRSYPEWFIIYYLCVNDLLIYFLVSNPQSCTYRP